MTLLRAGVDTSTFALWLGRAETKATQLYLHADLTPKEAGPRPHRADRDRTFAVAPLRLQVVGQVIDLTPAGRRVGKPERDPETT